MSGSDLYGPSRREQEFNELAVPVSFEDNEGPGIRGYLREPGQPGRVEGQVQLPVEAMDPVALDAFKGRKWKYRGPLHRRDGSVEPSYECLVWIGEYGFGSDGVRATIVADRS